MNLLRLKFTRTLLVLSLCPLLLALGCSKSSKAKRLIADGTREYQAQHYDYAETDFRSVLMLFPHYGPAYSYLGKIYFQEGRIPAAYEVLRLAHGLVPDDPEVTLRLAQVLVEVREKADASKLAADAMARMPTNEEPPLTLIDAAQTPQELLAASNKIHSAEMVTPTNAGFAAALGMLALRQHNADAAEKEFRRALQLDPQFSVPHLGLAGVCAARKDRKGIEQELHTAAQLAPPRSSIRLKYASYLIESGATETAKAYLLETIQAAHDYIPASLELMRLQYSQHLYNDCSDTAQKILARDPQNLEAMLQFGNLLLAQRNPARALEYFQRADSLYPRRAVIKYSIALAKLLQGDKESALAALRQAVSLDHSFSPAVVTLANLDLRAGDAEEALTLLNPLVRAEPGNVQAQLELANVYLAQQRPDPALAVYANLERRFTNNPEIPFFMGQIYEEQKRLPEAHAAYLRALALAPTNTFTLERLLDIDIRQADFTGARQFVDSQIAKNTNSSEPWVLDGQLNWAMSQTNKAINSFSTAIHLDPNRPAPYLQLARLYLAAHQDQQAIDRLSALTQRTNDVAAILELGMIYQVSHNYPAARDAYQKVISFNPRSVIAINNLAYLDSEYLNDLSAARTLAEQARQLQPYDPHGADTLGWILFKQGDYARALSLLQEAAQGLPGDPEILAHLGLAYYTMEEKDPARVYLQRALANNADFSGRADASQALALLAIDPDHASQSARDLIQNRLVKSPDDPIALSDLAAIELSQGHPERAVDGYNKILAHNSHDWNAMLQLAEIYAGPLNDLRKALDFAKSAHDAAPQEPSAAAVLGSLIYRGGDFQRAYDLLRNSAGQLQTRADIQFDLAQAAYATGNLSEADSAMANAVERGQSSPRLAEARQFLDLRAAAADFSKALSESNHVREILQQQPDNLPAEMVLGSLEEHSGDSAAAAQLYKKILSQYPPFTPAMRQLAIVSTRASSDDSDAYSFSQKALVAFPGDQELAHAVGILAYRHGDYQKSVNLIGSATDAQGLYYLGMDYYHLRNTAASKRTLNRALALDASSSLAAEARKLLANMP